MVKHHTRERYLFFGVSPSDYGDNSESGSYHNVVTAAWDQMLKYSEIPFAPTDFEEEM